MVKVLFFIYVLILISCKEVPQSLTTERNFCDSLHLENTTTLSKELKDIDSLMQSKTGCYVLEDGDGSMIARAWLSQHAENTMDIQYFIFSVDNVGLIACDYIVRAANRGVKVRILVDDIMVEADPEDILIMNAHENIDIKIYNPVANLGKNILQKLSKVVTDFRGINQRMHNKTFIIDKKVAITGGRNIADEYFDYDHEYNFRDRDILLMGKVVKDMQSSFETFWNHALSVDVDSVIHIDSEFISRPDRYDKLHNYACNPENYWPQVRQRVANLPEAFKEIKNSGSLIWLDSVYFISDEPGKNTQAKGLKGSGKSTDELIRLIQQAKNSIDIQSPYLVTTDLSRKLFTSAVSRGVTIRVLTNSLASTDNLEAFSGYQRDRATLLKTGIRIFEFRPDAAVRFQIMTGSLQKNLDFAPVFGHHAKTMVIDRHICVIGTFNLDPRSAHLNTECFVVIYSKILAENLMKGIETEFLPENAWESTLQWNPDKEVDLSKRVKTFVRRIIPKDIL